MKENLIFVPVVIFENENKRQYLDSTSQDCNVNYFGHSFFSDSYGFNSDKRSHVFDV